jgi:hypothetical protein
VIVSAALLKDLKVQLKLLQADLRGRAEDAEDAWGARLKEEYAEAFRRKRTGHAWIVWRDNEVDQAAVAWIVATTFLRFCEDNDLLAGAHLDGRPTPVGWIAGPGDRTQRTEENVDAYFRAHPTHNRRYWLQQGFRVLAAKPAGKALVDPQHNPVWAALISPESAAALIRFWRRTDGTGALVHDFTDPDLDTRFLGDLYQDLSEHAKKTYALLQTPVFVEEFILDQTLTPALNEFGHDGLKLIDPACGSGHFLLGAFERLVQRWKDDAPALDAKERVRRAMDSIHGVDLNPFAIAIARFRLTVAGLKAMREPSLAGVPALGFHLAIGDALLGEFGGAPQSLDLFNEGKQETYLYDAEDLKEYSGILQPGQYHVVVGNPPYITVKDKALNTLYRRAYKTTHRQYALSVPFMELFFRLAIRGIQGSGAGFVGQITSNSFMKREFGKKLIEDLFGGYHLDNPVDLTAVIDTSGAYIPGNGTPSAIIIGRRRRPLNDSVHAVLGVRGEPSQPDDPAKGLVWTEIVSYFDVLGYNGTYVSVTDLKRSVLMTHPWSLSGGGANAVLEAIENTPRRLVDVMADIGAGAVTREDDVYSVGAGTLRRWNISENQQRPLVDSEFVRDFSISHDALVGLWPYSPETLESVDEPAIIKALWPWKVNLSGRIAYGKSQLERRLRWFEYSMFFASRYRIASSITFAFFATHNHFVLDRGGKVFNRSALVIKLPTEASEEQHLELLGVLNSSTACFWLKQVSHDKGSQSGTGGFMHDEWERFYELTGTKLELFPLPSKLPLERARSLDAFAQELAAASPQVVVASWLAGFDQLDGREKPGRRVGLQQSLGEAEGIAARLRERMIFVQEELDWEVYGAFGLIEGTLTYPGVAFDQLALGERAFEIALQRRVEAGEESTAWFSRHGSTPTAEPPAEWPAEYADLVLRRLDLIESDPSIRLLEKPEFKRRWAATPWPVQLTDALGAAILDRLEPPDLWRDEQGPTTRSVAELADLLRADGVLRELAAVLTGNAEPDLAAVLGSLVTEEAVPNLAAHRYRPSGLEKHRVWQETWAFQRRVDAGEKVDIAVPPKYVQADFRRPAYWRTRGKLDVPKERFILYPDLRREGDPTPVLGWAGWDHRDQALALGRELPVQEMLGADDHALTPLIAGLVELEPWLHQWHYEDDPTYGASPAAVISQLIDQYLLRMEKTREQVTAWTPHVATRGRRSKRA